jgi:hypothetical protein
MYKSTFFISALAGGEWSASRPCRFTPEERAPVTHWIGGWVDPRASLDYVEKRKLLPSQGSELVTLGRPPRSRNYTDYAIVAPLTVRAYKKDGTCGTHRDNNNVYKSKRHNLNNNGVIRIF